MMDKLRAAEGYRGAEQDTANLQPALAEGASWAVAHASIMRVLRKWDGHPRHCAQRAWATATRAAVNGELKRLRVQPLKPTRRRYWEGSSQARSKADHQRLLHRALEDVQSILDGISRMLNVTYVVAVVDGRNCDLLNATSESVAGIVQALQLGSAMNGWASVNHSRLQADWEAQHCGRGAKLAFVTQRHQCDSGGLL
jgi:hypothetical protein